MVGKEQPCAWHRFGVFLWWLAMSAYVG